MELRISKNSLCIFNMFGIPQCEILNIQNEKLIMDVLEYIMDIQRSYT